MSYFYFDLIWLSTHRNYFSDETTLCLSLFSLICFSFPKGMYLTMGSWAPVICCFLPKNHWADGTLSQHVKGKSWRYTIIFILSTFLMETKINIVSSWPLRTVLPWEAAGFPRSKDHTGIHLVRLQVICLCPEPPVDRTNQCHESSCLTRYDGHRWWCTDGSSTYQLFFLSFPKTVSMDNLSDGSGTSG